MTDITVLRDELLKRKTIQEQAVLNSEKALAKIEEIQSKFSDEDYSELQRKGLNIDFLRDLDKERLIKDADYLALTKATIAELTNTISQQLEEILCSD